jgi:hypothetical protein
MSASRQSGDVLCGDHLRPLVLGAGGVAAFVRSTSMV